MKEITVTEYKKIISRGLGKAILVLENSSGIEKYKDAVLWACLNNTCYDAQSEGSRAWYLYEALTKFNDDKYFQERITAKFNTLKNDVHLFEQLTELLFYFAKDGEKSAKDTLYKKYDDLFNYVAFRKVRKNTPYRPERDCLERLCVWLRELDGFKGFKKIVDDLSAFYQSNKNVDPFDFEWFYENAKNNLGDKRVSDYLQKVGISYELFRYTRTADAITTVPTIDEIIKASKKPWNENRGLVVKFAKHGTQDELDTLAQVIIEEANLDAKANMLWAFTIKPFPQNPDVLIEYSKSENEELRDNAFEALAKITSRKVRDYALKLLSGNHHLAEALSMLCANFQKEDRELLTRFIKRVKVSHNDGVWHGVFSSAMDLLRDNKDTPEELLRYLFDKTLCAFCREYIVLAMNKRKCITKELLYECKHDCNYNIRKFAYKKLKLAKEI